MHTLQIEVNEQIIKIDFEQKCNLSQLLIENDIFIDRACGGKGTCGKCAVRFISGAPNENEFDKKHLSVKQIKEGFRLSCKCNIEWDAEIEIIEKHNINAVEYGVSDINEISFMEENINNGYGAAVDLGTTTIVVYLVNLKDGEILGVKSTVNPQRKYGDNVITRSEYINTHENGLETLKTEALEEINRLIASAAKECGIKPNQIVRTVLSGNTIMQHIIFGVNPFQITVAPYTPVTEQKKVSATEFGLNINPDAECFITNSISGYIGGDIVAGIIASGMDKSDETQMLIDIGTNGEMVLSYKGKMYSCSVAAGPAFEGEHIKYGVGGIAGAINKAFSKNNKLKFETIKNEKPIGICGSGILDITAFLLENEIIDEMGTMDESKCTKIDNEIVYYVTEDIYISQKDIREIQLAKSAVAAGAEVLIAKAGISYEEITNVYLAGGFGSYLDVNSAAKIGLINKELETKCISAGNTAGMGSVKALLSDNVLSSLDELVCRVEYIELSFDKSFNDLFIDNMMF